MAEYSASKTDTPGEWYYRGFRIRNAYKLWLNGSYYEDGYAFGEYNNEDRNYWEISEIHGDFPISYCYQEDLHPSKEACMSQIDKWCIADNEAANLKRKKKTAGEKQFEAFLNLKKQSMKH